MAWTGCDKDSDSDKDASAEIMLALVDETQPMVFELLPQSPLPRFEGQLS